MDWTKLLVACLTPGDPLAILMLPALAAFVICVLSFMEGLQEMTHHEKAEFRCIHSCIMSIAAYGASTFFYRVFEMTMDSPRPGNIVLVSKEVTGILVILITMCLCFLLLLLLRQAALFLGKGILRIRKGPV